MIFFLVLRFSKIFLLVFTFQDPKCKKIYRTLWKNSIFFMFLSLKIQIHFSF